MRDACAEAERVGEAERRVVAEAESRPAARGSGADRRAGSGSAARTAARRAAPARRARAQGDRGPRRRGSCRAGRPRTPASSSVSTSRGRSRSYASGAAPSARWPCPAIRKKVERAPSERSSAAVSAKRQFGSVPRSLWSGTRASPRASCTAGPASTREGVTLQPGGRAAHADPRPAPRDVDVVSERHREPRASVARRLDAELPPQPLERRIERIETRGGREEAAVAVDARLRAPRRARDGRSPPRARLRPAARRARLPPTPPADTARPRRDAGRTRPPCRAPSAPAARPAAGIGTAPGIGRHSTYHRLRDRTSRPASSRPAPRIQSWLPARRAQPPHRDLRHRRAHVPLPRGPHAAALHELRLGGRLRPDRAPHVR